MKSHRRASSPRIKNLESNPEMVQKFSVLWNEIIASFREEDIISDTEFELLELPPNHWSLRVICWPSFLLCNELDIAIRAAAELRNATDKKLWYKICNNEYRRTAVIEAYDSVRYLLLLIIDPSTKEHTMVTDLFKKLDLALEDQKFTQEFDLSSLGSIRNWIIDFLYTLITPNAHPRRSTARALQNLYIVVVVDFIKGRKNNLQPNEGHFKEDVVKFPNDTIDEAFVRRLLTILISSNETMQYFPEIEKAKRGIEMQDFPRGEEAKRRITFFCNSVFMKIPRAPSVEKMKAFSVLTPYYEEDVLYSSKQVDIFKDNETTGSTSLLLPYLKTVYKDDWKNFKQRMRRQGMRHKRQLGTIKLNDLRLWASYRGQTLARTVRGMMYYRRALEILACLESLDSQTNQQLADEHGIVGMKFTYVVACQSYAVQKKRGDDERGADILYLMKNNEAMRVAYIDTVENCRGSGQHEYYSVLVKYDQTLNKEVEIYRIKLPGSCMLGEGKPENQNQAIIFTRGDAVQTIDMNQDNYLEEALKMPNLLEEFDKYHGIRKPTILGLREHIFTGSISSLAWFMSAQETGFVTSGQRVQANLLKVRMHYGHPDVFDRIWFMGRGGISKATRKINICEDIFAGFNCTLRGGNVTHHEYIQVGKGRDVSLDQITMFEAKIAGGSAGQLVSRDIYRLAHRVDFFRMLSLFHSTVGFYYNTVLVIWAIYAIQWSKVYVALSGLEATTNNGAIKSAFGAVFSIQVIQLVQYTGLPMIIEDALEHGLILGVKDFLIMQMQLASVFYTFSMGTRGHYFDRTVLHGGAKYLGTGREIIVQHQSFPEMYRLYSRSHFVKAIELALLIIVYDIYSPSNYGTYSFIEMNISFWFLVISWTLSPFIFNPCAFDWLKTVNELDDFMRWIWFPSGMFAKPEHSWERWWHQEQRHLRTSGSEGRVLEFIANTRFFFFQYGIAYHMNVASGSKSFRVYLLSWIFVVEALMIFMLLSRAHDKYAVKAHVYYRLVQSMTLTTVLVMIITLLWFTNLTVVDLFTSLLVLIPTGWGLVSIAQVFSRSLEKTVVWDMITWVARIYDLLFGLIIMAPVAILSWLPGVSRLQTRMLFNDAYVRGLEIYKFLQRK